jgi:hypothetical protein
MKIKSFKESFSDKFYHQVSKDEFYDIRFIDFTQQNKMDKWIESIPGFRSVENKLSYLFKPFFIKDSFYEKRGLQRRDGVMSYRIESNDWICFIFESDDEWFWANLERSGGNFSFTSTYFKCDQFDGLTKLLKDKNVI